MRTIEEIIVDYRDGNCSDDDLRQIMEQLNASEADRKEWLAMRLFANKGTASRFAEPEQIDRAYADLMRKDAARRLREANVVRLTTRRVTMRFLRIAAVIALLIGAFAVLRNVTREEPPQILAVTTGWNEQVQKICLSDSTVVWLSANSRLTYPDRFTGNKREVTLEGKAFFEVSKDSKKPFRVATDLYTVNVTGTSFEVNAFREQQITDVTLVEGSVNILNQQNNSLCTLNVGEQFTLNKENKQFDVRKVKTSLLTAWRNGKLEFDGMTLDEIVKSLERYYGVSIALDKRVNRHQRLVGSLSLGRDLNDMMTALAKVANIKFTIHTNTVVYVEQK